ncbi:hypothetical protein [Mariniflexile sp. HMF6888]|uniref:hypothetical protein n=1 Tax=Mariniflexile sp. HMF6888 TaxID=3373086 RepID=UPI0037BB9E45
MNTYYKKVMLGAILMVSISLFSQETFTKKVEKAFEMNNTGELHIDNKYGNVNVTGWNKNKIEIIVEIKVTNKKTENAKSLLDRIETNFRTASNFVSVASEISDKDTSFFSRYFNKVNPFEFDKGNIEINCTVNLPINAEIEVINKFGDVVIGNWTGKLKANLEHGDLWINQSIVNANIDMKFGKLRTKSMTYGTLNLKNGSADIDVCQDLVLKTSGSNIEINKVDKLKLISSKDEVAIEQVGSIDGDIKFSDVQINQLDKNINLTMKVVDFKVLKINQPDALVNINQESSDISINITGLSFKFDATLEEGVLRLPKSFNNVNSDVIDLSKRIRKVSANYGKSKSGTFTFTGNKGIIALKE